MKAGERRPEEKERLAEGKPLERDKEPREFKPLEREEKPEDFKHLKELPEDKKIAEIPSSRKEEEKGRPELVYPIGKEPTKEFPSFEGEPRKIPEGAIRPQEEEQRKPEAFPDRIPPEPKAAREGEVPVGEGMAKHEGPLGKEIPEHARLPEKEFPDEKKFGEKGAAPLGYGEKIPEEAAQKGKAAPSEKEPTSIPQKPEHELPLKRGISDEAGRPVAEERPTEEEVPEEESKKPKRHMFGLDKMADVLDENIPSLPGLPKTEGEEGEEELPPTKPAREAAKEPGAKEPERKEAFPPLSEALERKEDKFPPEKEEKRPSEERIQEKPGEIPNEPKILGKKPEETLRRDKEPQRAPSLQEQVDKVPEKIKDITKAFDEIPEKLQDIPEKTKNISKDLEDISERAKANAKLLDDEYNRHDEPPEELKEARKLSQEIPKQLDQISDNLREIPAATEKINKQLGNMQEKLDELPKNMKEVADNLKAIPRKEKEVPEAIPRKEKEVPEAIPRKEFERPEEPSQTLSMAEQLEKIPREKDGTPLEVPSELKEIPKEFKMPKEVEKIPTKPEFHEKEREPEKEKFKESLTEPKEISTTKAPEEVEMVPRGVGGEFAKVPVEPVFAAKEEPLPKKEEAFREKPLESGNLPSKLPREAEGEIPSVKEKPESIEAKESMLPKFKAPSKEFRVESPTPPVEEGRMEPESKIPKPSFVEVPQLKREPEMAAEISRVGPEGESRIPSVPLEGERQFPTEAAEKVGKTPFEGDRKESGVPKKVEEIIKEKPLGFVEEKIPLAPVPRMVSPMPSGYGMAEGKLAPETKPKLFKEEEITRPYPKVEEEIDLGKDIGISFPVEPTYESLPTIQAIQEKEIPPTEMQAPGLAKEEAIFPKEEARIEPFKEIPSMKGREIPSVERQATEGLPKGAELGHRPIEKEEFFPKEREETIPSDKEKITPSAVREAENLKEQQKVPPSWEDRKLTPEAIQEAEDIKAKYETLREAPSVIPKVEHELGAGIPVAEKLEQKEKMVPLVRPEEARRQEPAIEKPVYGKIPAEEGRKHEEPYPPFEKSKQKEEIPVEKTPYEGDRRVEYPKEMKQPIVPHPQEKEGPIQPEKGGVSPQSVTEMFLPAEKEEGYPPRPTEKEGYPSGPATGERFAPRPAGKEDYAIRPETGEGFVPRPSGKEEGYPPRPTEKEGYPTGPVPGEGFAARPVGKEGYPPHPAPEGYPPHPAPEGYPSGPAAEAGYPLRQTEEKAKPYYQPIEPYASMEEEPRKLEKDTGIVFPEMPKFKPIESILPKPVEQAPKADTKFGSNSSTEFVPTKPETYPVTDEKHYEPSAAERIPDASGTGKGPTIASIIQQYKEEPTLKEDLDETYQRTMPKRESPHPVEAVQKQGPPTEYAGAHEPRSVPSKEPAIEERHAPAPERAIPSREPAIEERHAPAPERAIPSREPAIEERHAPAPERVIPSKEPTIEERHAPATEAPKEKKKGFWQNIVESIPLMGEDSDEESAKSHKLPSEKTHAQPSERTHEPSAEEEPSHEDDESKGKKTFFENLLKKKSAFTKIPSTHGDETETETAEGHDEMEHGESQVQPDEYDVTQKSFMTFKGAQRKK